MSKAEKTRQFIIEKTAPIFNKKGYSGTSLSDITEATGLTKGSIYGNFGNKDDVALAAYEYNSTSLNKRIKISISEKSTAHEKLIAFIEFYRHNWKSIFESGGCPLLNTATEADDHLPFLKTSVQKSFKNWSDTIIQILNEGKNSNEFKNAIDTSYYAHSFIMLIEGGILLAKISNNQQLLFIALDRVIKIIDDEIVK